MLLTTTNTIAMISFVSQILIHLVVIVQSYTIIYIIMLMTQEFQIFGISWKVPRVKVIMTRTLMIKI